MLEMFVFDLHKNVIVRFFIILSLFSISLNVNSQSERSVKTKTIGVGLGYSISSSIGDSVSPINLSLRYRLGQKHTFQFYVPFYLKRSRKEELPGNWKETNWGIGVGYDYLFYSHSLLDFIAGVKGNYWWYQDRYDEKATIPVYKGDQVLYVKNSTYYYWEKVGGFCLIPNIGLRFSVEKATIELLIGVSISSMKKNSYSFREIIYPAAKTTWEEFYPDKNIIESKIHPDTQINLIYYF